MQKSHFRSNAPEHWAQELFQTRCTLKSLGRVVTWRRIHMELWNNRGPFADMD